MTLLFNKQPIITRFRNLHHAMTQRAAPKKWKSGARLGNIKTPGLSELPFLAMDLMDYAIELVGYGAIQCPYCVAIGRPANIIDLTNCVFDHFVPLKRGGSWELSNLRPCCDQCNREKGEMAYEVFVGILSALYAMVQEDPKTAPDRDYVLKCLKTHGIVMQGWKGKGKEGQTYPEPAPPRLQRTLDENF